MVVVIMVVMTVMAKVTAAGVIVMMVMVVVVMTVMVVVTAVGVMVMMVMAVMIVVLLVFVCSNIVDIDVFVQEVGREAFAANTTCSFDIDNFWGHRKPAVLRYSVIEDEEVSSFFATKTQMLPAGF